MKEIGMQMNTPGPKKQLPHVPIYTPVQNG